MINLHPCQVAGVKWKVCKVCESKFSPWSSTQTVCGRVCAAKLVKTEKAAEKAQIKARKEAIKTYSEWKADAQKAVNEFVRLRDQGKPCISCQKPWDATFQAGHYRSRGAAPQLALDPRNIAGQCVQCNLHKHGNQAAFRIGLIEREGVAHVEALESENEPLKLSVDELRQLKVIHKGMARELKRNA